MSRAGQLMEEGVEVIRHLILEQFGRNRETLHAPAFTQVNAVRNPAIALAPNVNLEPAIDAK
jgi:hypothetical protein